ncbi:MAG: PHP domain-containing protein, partial [Clostridiaceae bacterium]|nr:PHP domain-containing protein [Clostridiaceae bacterium]
MKLTNFIERGKFYKSNFHAHSTRSDGKLSQEDAINVFKEHGYNFLCLS